MWAPYAVAEDLSWGKYQFVITGRVVPYVRMTRHNKFVDERAKAYLAWQEDARWQLRRQMSEHGWQMVPERVPMQVRALFVPVRHNCDLDNLAKGMIDAAQGVVFHNDSWIDHLHAERIKDNHGERVLLYIRWPA